MRFLRQNKWFILSILFCILILLAFYIVKTPIPYHEYLISEADVSDILNQTKNLERKVLVLGLKAYRNACKMGITHSGILTIIDYTKPSDEFRFWTLNLSRKKMLIETLVAHGIHSGERYARVFSNVVKNHASSIGMYLTGRTYIGKHGRSLRLFGLEKGFNDHVFKRKVVIHSAWYVSENIAKKYGMIGRSWGCPAVCKRLISKVINKIKNGTIVFIYYNNEKWLKTSKFLKNNHEKIDSALKSNICKVQPCLTIESDPRA